jgi:hypothetical protein
MVGVVGAVLAHEGGWDEAFFLLVPIAIFGGLIVISNRRASDESGEHGPEGPNRSQGQDERPGRG